jgi:hypothetical protein
MPNTPDLFGLPDHQWTGRKRRSLFRPRRLEHLAAMAPVEPSTDGRDGNGDVPPAGDRLGVVPIDLVDKVRAR